MKQNTLHVHLLFLSFIFNRVLCQQWLTETHRTVYGLNNKELNVTWKLSNQNKEILYASWQLANAANNQPEFTLLSVNGAGAITIYNQDEIESQTFGEITFKKLDQSKYRKILVTVDFKDDSTSFTDTLTIDYVDYAPFFTKFLPSTPLKVIENTPGSRNQVMNVTVKGKPKPTVIWKVNGKNVQNLTGYTIVETQSIDNLDTVIQSELKIDELTAKDNGILTVTAKYGSELQLSPEKSLQRNLDIQYKPQIIDFSTNITNNLIISEGGVKVTCKASANPPAIYTVTESNNAVYNGPNEIYSTYIDKIYHTRYASFQCIANNTLGFDKSAYIEIKIQNGTSMAGISSDEDSTWWVYYAVGVGVGTVAFVGVAVTLMIIRSCILNSREKDGIR